MSKKELLKRIEEIKKEYDENIYLYIVVEERYKKTGYNDYIYECDVDITGYNDYKKALKEYSKLKNKDKETVIYIQKLVDIKAGGRDFGDCTYETIFKAYPKGAALVGIDRYKF